MPYTNLRLPLPLPSLGCNTVLPADHTRTLYEFLRILRDALPLWCVLAVATGLDTLHHTKHSGVAQLVVTNVKERRLSRQHCVLRNTQTYTVRHTDRYIHRHIDTQTEIPKQTSNCPK